MLQKHLHHQHQTQSSNGEDKAAATATTTATEESRGVATGKPLSLEAITAEYVEFSSLKAIHNANRNVVCVIPGCSYLFLSEALQLEDARETQLGPEV